MQANPSTNQQKFQQIVALVAEYGREDVEKLVAFLIQQGYSYQDVADILQISKQAVHQRFTHLKAGSTHTRGRD